MKFCKCGSIMLADMCSNTHCGKKVIMWAKEDKKYNEDLQLGNDLIFKNSAVKGMEGYEKFHHIWEW